MCPANIRSLAVCLTQHFAQTFWASAVLFQTNFGYKTEPPIPSSLLLVWKSLIVSREQVSRRQQSWTCSCKAKRRRNVILVSSSSWGKGGWTNVAHRGNVAFIVGVVKCKETSRWSNLWTYDMKSSKCFFTLFLSKKCIYILFPCIFSG